MQDCGIYKITNTKNGKCYIGQTINLKSRWQHHRANLRGNRHSNRYLQFAFNKYGEKSFKYEIICRCEENQLDDLERYYITFCNSMAINGNGYNIEDGGNAQKHLAEETKRLKSQQLKGKKWTEEHKKQFSKCLKKRSESFKANYKKENHPNYGKKFSKERCERMSRMHGCGGDIEEAIRIYLEEGLSSEKSAEKANVGKRRLKEELRKRGLMRPSPAKDHNAFMVAMAKRKSQKGIPRSAETREKIRLGHLKYLDGLKHTAKEPTDENIITLDNNNNSDGLR